MNLILLGFAGVAIGLALLGPVLGLSRLLTVGLVMSLAVAPYPLSETSDQVHYGNTTGELTVMTYTLVLVSLLVGMTKLRGVGRVVVYTGIVVSYLSVLAIFSWGATLAQWSGIAHIATTLVAVGVGIGIAQRMEKDLLLVRLIALACLIAISIQIILSCAQLLGISASVYDDAAYFVAEHRPIGSFNHPSLIGKIALLLFVILLPLTRHTDRLTRRLSWATVILAVPVVTATQARVNTLAVLAAVVLWLLFDPRLSRRGRLGVLVGAGIASIAVGLVLLPRFLSDPEGGDRTALLATGLEQLRLHLWVGLGAESYAEVVGQGDVLAASGYPVHNTFLLAIIELGLLGAVLLFAPFVVVVIYAIRSVRRSGPVGDSARAVLVVLPGLLVIAMTGWGLLTAGTFVLWGLVTGMAYWTLRFVPHEETRDPQLVAEARDHVQ